MHDDYDCDKTTLADAAADAAAESFFGEYTDA